MKIWKFAVPIQREIELRLPSGARILTVQTKDDEVNLWALVNPDADKETRHFEMYGTGHEVDDAPNLNYVGTTQQAIAFDGVQTPSVFVWHIFEVIRWKEKSASLKN